jgi:hypothetical protein
MIWLYLIALTYIIFSVYRNRKGVKRFDAREVWESMKENSFRVYFVTWLIFVFIFVIFRMIALAQTEAQTCNVWEEDMQMRQGWELRNPGMNPNWTVKKEEWTGSVSELEQGRSYNYYRRYFNSHGGRPIDFISIKCDWELEKFIKNIVLDYNEREVNNG